MKELEALDWHSPSSSIFTNPKTPFIQQEPLPSQWQGFEMLRGHLWLKTSGTSEGKKWVAISKKAFLLSAQSVNTHLSIQKSEKWINPLPHFHVGGLSIYARAFLLDQEVISFWNFNSWDPKNFCRALQKEKAQLTSLVPAQVFDIVKEERRAPSCLRLAIIGGGKLHFSVLKKALELGWPIITTYGLTECSSQVATSQLKDPLKLIPLSHVTLKTNSEDLLSIQSQALFTGYLRLFNKTFSFEDPKEKGWFHTQDKATISPGELNIIGRKDEVIKIGGENVFLPFLEERFESIKESFQFSFESVLFPLKDERLNFIMTVVTTPAGEKDLAPLIEVFNSQVMPFEKIRCVKVVPQIPRSELGKVQKNHLSNLLDSQLTFL